MTFWSGLLFYIGYTQNIIPNSLKIAASLGIVFMNVTFFCYAVYKFGKEFIQDYKAHKKDLEEAHLQDEQNNTHVVPVSSGNALVEKVDDPEDDNNETNEQPQFTLKHTRSTIAKAEALHNDFHEHELALQIEQNKRQQKQRRKTQNRVLARLEIRKSKALTRVPMFEKLSSDAIESILDLTTYEKHIKGDVLCTQDDLATEFYIIVSGQCAVKVHGKSGASRRVSTLKALDFFGESGLVQGENKRNATVVAESDFVQVLLLSCENFSMLLESGVLSADVLSTVEKESERRVEVTRKSFMEPIENDSETTVVVKPDVSGEEASGVLEQKVVER